MPTLLHVPGCNFGMIGCLLFVHYWADLQSVRQFRCYGKRRVQCEMSARTLVSVLAVWLVIKVFDFVVSVRFVGTMKGSGKCVNCLVILHNRRANAKRSRKQNVAIVETRDNCFDCCIIVLARKVLLLPPNKQL